jgi:hypothetical protein
MPTSSWIITFRGANPASIPEPPDARGANPAPIHGPAQKGDVFLLKKAECSECRPCLSRNAWSCDGHRRYMGSPRGAAVGRAEGESPSPMIPGGRTGGELRKRRRSPFPKFHIIRITFVGLLGLLKLLGLLFWFVHTNFLWVIDSKSMEKKF